MQIELEVFDNKNAAKALNISISTLTRYRKKGTLAYRQIGDRILYTKSDLIALLNECAVPATVIPTNREKREMAKATGGEL